MLEGLITGITVLGGAIIGYFISNRLAIMDKQRETKLCYLVEAYMILDNASNQDELHKDIEKAFSILQLFGSKHQIALASKFIVDLSDKKTASIDELLRVLKDDLRRELRLESTEGKLLRVRVSHR